MNENPLRTAVYLSCFSTDSWSHLLRIDPTSIPDLQAPFQIIFVILILAMPFRIARLATAK